MAIRAQSDQILFAVVAQMAPHLEVMYLQVRPIPAAWHRHPHAAGSPVATNGRPRARAVFGLAWEEPDSWCCARAFKNPLSLSSWQHLYEPANGQNQSVWIAFLQIGSGQEIRANHLETISTGFVGTQHQARGFEGCSITAQWLS
jgi:hypothetical protein